MSRDIDIAREIQKIVARPLILEREGAYEDAIKAYLDAIDFLNTLIEKFKKAGVNRLNRKLYQRQVQVHRDRLTYLQALSRKGRIGNVISLPTMIDVVSCLARQEEDNTPWGLSQVRQALYEHKVATGRDTPSGPKGCPPHLKPFVESSDTSQFPFLTPSLPANAEPVIYRISHDSEFVELGARSHWLFVKDSTNTHLLYGLQAIWSDQVPIVEAVLRRPGEFLPQVGAVNVKIRKTPGGSFRLVTSTLPNIGLVIETPDRGQKRKEWSPRRFEYGGRNFVWKSRQVEGKNKSADGGFLKSFAWEALYETKRVWPKEGSQTGKLEDETFEQCLCWGEKGGGNGAAHSIYMNPGLDTLFQEHLLAAQMARFMRCKYPPHKDVKGVEAVEAGSTILSILELAS